jgi:acyl carrier protein
MTACRHFLFTHKCLVKKEIKMEEKILALLSEEFPEIDFESSDALVDDGILDSLTITGIIATLSMEFGITIPYEEIIEENFNSVAGLAKMVERLS